VLHADFHCDRVGTRAIDEREGGHGDDEERGRPSRGAESREGEITTFHELSSSTSARRKRSKSGTVALAPAATSKRRRFPPPVRTSSSPGRQDLLRARSVPRARLSCRANEDSDAVPAAVAGADRRMGLEPVDDPADELLLPLADGEDDLRCFHCLKSLLAKPDLAMAPLAASLSNDSSRSLARRSKKKFLCLT